MSACTVSQEEWGQADGKPVLLFTLANAHGTKAKITNYGGIVSELWTRDQAGKLADVVLGFRTLAEYQKSSPYFGAIAGRVANRIAKGKFDLDGKSYELATNNGPNHLHGGMKGFDKVVWNAIARRESDRACVDLAYRSKDGEEGYPGTLDAKVSYELTANDELIVRFQATADAPTLCNLVHHSYWNLSGEGSGPILGHELKLMASRYTPADGTLIPTGEIASVQGTPFDFTAWKAIGKDIATLQGETGAGHGGGYDVNLAVDAAPGKERLVAQLYDPASGRNMQIHSDMPGIQFYSGNFLDGTLTGKSGKPYAKYGGLCLETQLFPDAIHHANFASPVLEPGQTYRHVMRHTFGVGKP